MKRSPLIATALSALALAACSQTLQTTSGADYLAGYDGRYTVPAGHTASDVDAAVREVAAIEPNIRFPARIGLARIEHGRLTAIPGDEGPIWADMASSMGPLYGEFVPVSPLVTAMVANNRNGDQLGAAKTISDIRLGAARQHLDYVFTYEVSSAGSDKANALSLADVTIIGMFVLPSRNVKVEASASGILLDVRNGYPYATMTAFADKQGVARFAYTDGARATLGDKARLVAVEELADDMKAALEGLAEVYAETQRTGGAG